MPAPPCPQCARPVQAGRPTCLYCGAALSGQAAAPAAGPSAWEPDKIDSIDKVKAVMTRAMDHCKADRIDEATRLMGRLFKEVAFGDLKALLEGATGIWLESLKGHVAAEDLLRAKLVLTASAGALGEGDLEKAHKGVQIAVELAGKEAFHNSMVPLLALGLKGALAQARKPAPEAEPDAYSKLTAEAAQALVTPGRLEEGLQLLEKAVGLLPDPPVTERDKARKARVLGLLAIYRKDQPKVPPPPAPRKPEGGGNQGNAGWADFTK